MQSDRDDLVLRLESVQEIMSKNNLAVPASAAATTLPEKPTQDSKDKAKIAKEAPKSSLVDEYK